MSLLESIRSLAADLIDESRKAPGLFGEIARIEQMLADTYRDRVQYELLQNSDDAGARDVWLASDSPGVFTWQNNGRIMSEQDVSGLCRSATSVKSRGEAIGYRGIGFKSLAAVAKRITVASGNVTFDFDRDASQKVLGVDDPALVPLIRIPTNIREANCPGAKFRVEAGGEAPNLTMEPTALLFLRNVESVHSSIAGTSSISVQRSGGVVTIRAGDGDAEFALLETNSAQVALPLSPAARALAGSSGRLACFLPLDEVVGFPVIVSGDVTTDPSRTHAIVEDPETSRVLVAGAAVVADVLRDPGHEHFAASWNLLLAAPDPRSAILNSGRSIASAFMKALRANFASMPPNFALIPVDLNDDEIISIFPTGAPKELYSRENRTAARALRVALGIPSWDIDYFVETVPPKRLSSVTCAKVAQLVADNARVQGRPLTAKEEAFGPSGGSTGLSSNLAGSASNLVSEGRKVVPAREQPDSDAQNFPQLLERWRVAETAVVEWLNARGWQLKDVSKQNLGYDAEGIDSYGERVCLEVKKVDRLDASFAMTTNEWALSQAGVEPMLIAIVIGDGRRSRLALLDPIASKIVPIRVARQWEWRFENWSQSIRWID